MTGWFEVELDTLRLKAADLAGWPQGMASSGNRMPEECMESIVALNLDVLFPREELLLVGVRPMGWRSADVVALDPLGFLRLIELKKTPTQLESLNDQAISYGLLRDSIPPWDHMMARALPDLPERIQLSLEAFRVSERVQVLGEKYVAKHLAEALSVPWDNRNRFEKAHVVANALRAARGAPAGPVALEDTRVREVLARLYGIAITERSLANPEGLCADIVEARWGRKPAVCGTEFTVVAPGLSGKADSTLPLEQRDGCFYLIEADLRSVVERNGVNRALLWWRPLRRTIGTSDLQTTLALRARLRQDHPEAGGLWWDPHGATPRLYWGAMREAFLRVETMEGGIQMLVTRGDALTQGLAYLKPKRAKGLRDLRATLTGRDIGTRGDELTAPWDPANLQPAVELAAAYFRLLKELGFFSVDEYQWYRRPQI